MIGGKADRVADEGFTQTAATGGGAHAHALDLATGAALAGEAGNDGELKRAEDLAGLFSATSWI